MRLPRVQRSSVILMDVLGYSLNEIGAIMDASLPAVKSALHRGRTRLHELANEPEDAPPPVLSPTERTLLAGYIDRFNARDYDAVRAMLAEEVRLDLVNRVQLNGKAEVAALLHQLRERDAAALRAGLRRRPSGRARLRGRGAGCRLVLRLARSWHERRPHPRLPLRAVRARRRRHPSGL